MRIIALLLLCASITTPAIAQRGSEKEPARPNLPAHLDPNSAFDVYAHGSSLLAQSPARAAEAFYWAARLDPTWADPLYARRVAVLMSDPQRFYDYMRGASRAIRAPEVQRADSLYRRALMLNPFLRRKHDVVAITQTLLWIVEREIRREQPTAMVDRTALEYNLDNYLRRADPETRAWMAHSDGRFPDALQHYRDAIRRTKEPARLHGEAGRVLFLMGRYGEARDELESALGMLREGDQEKLVRIYESKALYEHSIGLILEQLGDPAGARAAYARALQEDLSYYPAHIRLGELSLAAGDSATALNELALAVQIQEDAVLARFAYARALIGVGRGADAASELRRVIALEPMFALPYKLLGDVAASLGDAAGAVEHYRAFLDQAPRTSQERELVSRRLRELGEASDRPEVKP